MFFILHYFTTLLGFMVSKLKRLKNAVITFWKLKHYQRRLQKIIKKLKKILCKYILLILQYFSTLLLFIVSQRAWKGQLSVVIKALRKSLIKGVAIGDWELTTGLPWGSSIQSHTKLMLIANTALRGIHMYPHK